MVTGAVNAAMENGSEDTGSALLGLPDTTCPGADAAPAGRVLTDVPVSTDKLALLRLGQVRSSTENT